jgi:hypothetical protein
MKPLATARTYDELILGLRARADELKISRETIDAISGLQSGYASKLLAPVPIRTLSRVSLGAMLGSLGLKIILVEDAETLQKIEKRLMKRRRRLDADAEMPTAKKRKRRGIFKGDQQWGRIMRARATMLRTPEQRSAHARKAAKARWRKTRTSRPSAIRTPAVRVEPCAS